MSDANVRLDALADAVRPTLLGAGFEEAGAGVSGPYTWARFRRQETRDGERCDHLITLSHAPQEQAFLVDAYLVAGRTYTYTPAGKELRRYGTPAEAEAAVSELAAAVRAWVGA